MPTIGHSKPFGLRDLKVTTIDGVTQVDLPTARTLSIKPRFSSGELMGDDVIASVISFIIGADWDMEGAVFRSMPWLSSLASRLRPPARRPTRL